jgi:hypothetical protein
MNQKPVGSSSNKKRLYVWLIVGAVVLVLIALAGIDYYYAPVENSGQATSTTKAAPLTVAQKEAILAKLSASSSSSTLSVAQKEAVLANLSNNSGTTSSSSQMSNAQKEAILQSLSSH